jgi:hypothetical protein
MRLPRRRGITTADALVLCGGVSVLALFVALWLRGIPEQARYARCLSHLRLLGRAMELYRQDYATTARPASMDEMGLPPNLLVLAQAKRPTGEPYLPEGLTALRCPDEKSPVLLGCSYGYNTWTAGAEKPQCGGAAGPPLPAGLRPLPRSTAGPSPEHPRRAGPAVGRHRRSLPRTAVLQ